VPCPVEIQPFRQEEKPNQSGDNCEIQKVRTAARDRDRCRDLSGSSQVFAGWSGRGLAKGSGVGGKDRQATGGDSKILGCEEREGRS
jgi:hypothetical protein